MRFKMELPLDMPKDEIEKTVLADERAAKWMEGKTVRKFIFVPKKIINIAVG
jgi:leucyl-tRNA synthetase